MSQRRKELLRGIDETAQDVFDLETRREARKKAPRPGTLPARSSTPFPMQGEPALSGQPDSRPMNDQETIESGEPIYDEEGTELGVVTGSTADGLTVSVNEEVEYVSNDESGTGETSENIDPSDHDPGPEFGEGYLMWRCEECGEMGELDDGFPDECPNCGSEEVIKWKED